MYYASESNTIEAGTYFFMKNDNAYLEEVVFTGTMAIGKLQNARNGAGRL